MPRNRARECSQLKHLFLNMKFRFIQNPETDELTPEEKLFAKFCNEAMLEMLSNSKGENHIQDSEMGEKYDNVVLHPLDVVSVNHTEPQVHENTLNVHSLEAVSAHTTKPPEIQIDIDQACVKEEKTTDDCYDPLDNDHFKYDSDNLSDSDDESLDFQDQNRSQSNVGNKHQKYLVKAEQNLVKLKQTYLKIKISNARLQRRYMIRKSELELRILQEKMKQLKKCSYRSNIENVHCNCNSNRN